MIKGVWGLCYGIWVRALDVYINMRRFVHISNVVQNGTVETAIYRVSVKIIESV